MESHNNLINNRFQVFSKEIDLTSLVSGSNDVFWDKTILFLEPGRGPQFIKQDESGQHHTRFFKIFG